MKQKTIFKHSIYLMLICISAFINIKQLNAQSFSCKILNINQVSAKVLEFDVYLTNTSSNVYLLNGFQAGIDFNYTGMVGGGTITGSFVANSNSLPAPQNAPNWNVNATSKQIRMLAALVTASGAAASIPSSPASIKLGTFRLTNTVPFTANSTPNFAWSFITAANKTKTAHTAWVNGGTSPISITTQTTFSYSSQGPQYYVANNPILNPTTTPSFIDSTSTLTICQNAGATDLKNLLHISDTTSGKIETWSQLVAPSNGGLLTISNATSNSGSTDITPGGTITYTPVNAGTETFTVQVSDGNGGTVSKTITVTVNTSTHNVTTQTANGNYTWNGTNYTSSGTYLYSYNNANGCASVDTLKLTILTPTLNIVTSFTDTFSSCSPFISSSQGFRISGSNLTSNITITAPTGYVIYTGNNQATNSITLTQLGDSVNSTLVAIYMNATVAGVYNGNITISSAGATTLTIPVKGTVHQRPDFSNVVIADVCKEASSTTISFTNTGGNANKYAIEWDNPAAANSLMDSDGILGGSPLTISLSSNINSGSYTGYFYVMDSVTECTMSSGIPISLNVKAPSISTTNITIPDTQLPYSWNGLTFNAAGTQTAHLTNAAGCDSAATLNLTVKTPTLSVTGALNNFITCAGTASASQMFTISGSNLTSNLVINIPNGYQIGLTPSGVSQTSLSLIPNGGSISRNILIRLASTASGNINGNITVSSTGASSQTLSVTGVANTGTHNAEIQTATGSYVWHATTYTASGIYTYNYNNGSGCSSADTLHLTITPSCTPTASTTTTAICTSALPYSWNGLVFTAAGTQTAHLINAGGCDSAATITVTTKVSPTITSITNGVSNITATSLCTLGATTRYYNATPYGVWSSDNGAVASVTGGSQSGSITANSNGTATIKYIVSNTTGCSSSASLLVTVAQQATPNAITGNSVVCAGTTTALSSTTPSGVWSSANDRGTINTTGIYSGNNAGAGQVKYTVTNASGCSAYASKTIVVNAIPAVPTITYSSTSAANRSLFTYGGNFCVGKSCTVVGIPSGGSWAYTNPAAGTITNGGLVNFIGVGSGAIVYTYTDANGCSNRRTMSGTVAVCPIPKSSAAGGEGLLVSNDFTMYPNPAKGFIKLNVETLVGKGSIVVTDLYGKTVKNQPLSMGTNTIDIASLTKGFYLVSMITSEGKTTKKLIVE